MCNGDQDKDRNRDVRSVFHCLKHIKLHDKILNTLLCNFLSGRFQFNGTKCHIQPTQCQTWCNSIFEVVVLKFDKKGETPNKHMEFFSCFKESRIDRNQIKFCNVSVPRLSYLDSVHVLKYIGSTKTKLNFGKCQSPSLIFKWVEYIIMKVPQVRGN